MNKKITATTSDLMPEQMIFTGNAEVDQNGKPKIGNGTVINFEMRYPQILDAIREKYNIKDTTTNNKIIISMIPVLEIVEQLNNVKVENKLGFLEYLNRELHSEVDHWSTLSDCNHFHAHNMVSHVLMTIFANMPEVLEQEDFLVFRPDSHVEGVKKILSERINMDWEYSLD